MKMNFQIHITSFKLCGWLCFLSLWLSRDGLEMATNYLQYIPSRNGVYLLISWLLAGFVRCFYQQNEAEVTVWERPPFQMSKGLFLTSAPFLPGLGVHCLLFPILPVSLGSFRNFPTLWIRQGSSCFLLSLGLSHFTCMQSSNGMRYYFRLVPWHIFYLFNVYEKRRT